jgi:hypothetical protein
MSISTFNPANVRNFCGDVFLAAYPSVSPGTDTTILSVLKGYFGQWYADGQKKASLTGSPWAITKGDGLSLDPKMKILDTETNNPVPKIISGMYPDAIEADLTITDPSRDKLAEVLSALSAHLVNTPAAAGQPGQSGLLMGPQTAPTFYTFMFRGPSKRFAGLYDHLLLPRVFIDPSSLKIELAKTKNFELKLKMRPQGDLYLIDPSTTIPVWGYYEESSAPAAS